MPMMTEPALKTDRLGGVDVPSAQVLEKMHNSGYVLRARDGELSEVPAEKVLLPREQETSPQAVQVVKAPDGRIFANLAHIICQSSDGGKTWEAHDKPLEGLGYFVVLEDGTFIGLGSEGEHPNERASIQSSTDEGRTWEKIGRIPNPPGCWGGASWMVRLPDETLVTTVAHPDFVFEEVDGQLVLKSGGAKVFAYRSTDRGHTWSEPIQYANDWLSEGDVALTPSGKLLAAHRYQRPSLPGDPPDAEERTGSISPGWVYKHIVVLESEDQGRSWKDFRQLTTAFGQTFGRPAALNDGTVIMIHDTRYGPGPAGSRAMISRDEGCTFEDEVYYLDYTTFVGSYNGSVVLEDDLVLTLAASSQAGNSWDEVRNETDVYAIRWRPVR